jgi:uncharacterized integral membrane protein
MIRLIVSGILLVLLAVFVSQNLASTASVNLLGIHSFEGVSIVAISALSFAFGITYSLFLYLGGYLHRKAKRNLADKVKTLNERGKILDIRDAKNEKMDSTAPQA